MTHSDPVILGFDTSAKHVAAALLQGDKLLASRSEDMARGQAERLMPLLHDVLTEAGKDWPDLNALGVGIGPGNFTGIRISVSAARGLALGLGVPAYGVSSFEALAFSSPEPSIATVEAPREQVYLQVFDKSGQTDPVFCGLSEVRDLALPDQKLWIGAHAEQLASDLGGSAATPTYPVAEAIARMAFSRFPQPTARPAPLYIKAADAAPPSDPAPVILP